MAGRTKRQLEDENAELRQAIESVYDQLADFIEVDEDEDEEDEEDEDEEEHR